MHPMLIVACVGFALILGAWGLWFLVRTWDRTNAILASTPLLPIRLVNVWDPAWIRGEVECDDPRVIPHFRRTCVHFTYTLEEHVRKTRRRSDGKEEVYYEWETRDRQSGFAPFRIRQDEDVIEVDVAQASWQYEPAQSETLGSWRHSCSYTPYPGVASVVGVVGEKKQRMEPLRHVPLIVTPRERRGYLEAAERAERIAARFGLALLLLGFLGIAYGLIRFAQIPQQSEAPVWDAVAVGLALGAGLGCTALFWALRTYNSLVTFRKRADQSWSGIDIHLKQRYDLIPKLVECVKGYMQYERELLEHLAALRTQALAGGMASSVRTEGQTLDDLGRLVVVIEKYPNLKADQLFRKLADQITAIEEKIAHARMFFNDSVQEYNVAVGVFPANLVAKSCGFIAYPLFAADVVERAPVRIGLTS
jgi:LemA protein